jgi:hypothetical protein
MADGAWLTIDSSTTPVEAGRLERTSATHARLACGPPERLGGGSVRRPPSRVPLCLTLAANGAFAVTAAPPRDSLPHVATTGGDALCELLRRGPQRPPRRRGARNGRERSPPGLASSNTNDSRDRHRRGGPVDAVPRVSEHHQREPGCGAALAHARQRTSTRSLAMHAASRRSAVPETTRAHGPTIARTGP